MKQMILKIDDDSSFSSMADDLKLVISKTKIQWPKGQMVGTESYYNKRLILILSPIEPDDIEALLKEFDLNWHILAVEGEKINQDPILKFMSDIVLLDGEGEQTGFKEITDLTGILQTYAGRSWTY